MGDAPPTVQSADLVKVQQAEEKLLDAMEMAATVMDQLATVGKGNPPAAGKLAEQFIILLKESHELVSAVAQKYSVTTPARADIYPATLQAAVMRAQVDALTQKLEQLQAHAAGQPAAAQRLPETLGGQDGVAEPAADATAQPAEQTMDMEIV